MPQERSKARKIDVRHTSGTRDRCKDAAHASWRSKSIGSTLVWLSTALCSAAIGLVSMRLMFSVMPSAVMGRECGMVALTWCVAELYTEIKPM